MKERPMLFSAPMVRAILDGRKTVTRRIVKARDLEWMDVHQGLREPDNAERCPYGQPGDRLWVRESWSPDPPDVDGWGYTAWAGCREGQIAGVPERFRHPRFCNYAADWLHGPIRWTPSIHMPRWASRITLEVTGVLVERLQDISEKDAQAEGIERTEDFFGCPCWRVYGEPDGADVVAPDDPIGSYRSLWELINGPGSWEQNPFVWVINFRRVGG